MTPHSNDISKPIDNVFTRDSSIGIKVSNLSKTFSSSCSSCCRKSGLVKACNDISFEVKKNQLVTVLGQNGAGKTTLINMLTGFLEPSWGEAWIAGYTLTNDMSQIREITSLCPQFDIYWPDLTIEEHLEIFSIIKGLHEKNDLRREIQKTLNLVGLTDKKDERVQFLSGGMRRRLAIGISTISDPLIIFFDEPTTGLDPVTKDNILKLIKGSLFGNWVNGRTQERENTCTHNAFNGRSR
jgi:ATP-binding cassette subfamily A (ABC1) protein 3